MNIVALIPARAGSQRFRGKNHADFMGRPLFVHSTDFAKASPLVDRHYVTTNDSYIMNLCGERKIPYIERPDKYCKSISNSSGYIGHFLDTLREKGETLPDALLILQPTNPIREHRFLKEMVGLYRKHTADCVFTVVKSKSKMGRIINETFVPFNYEFEQRFQDMEDFYEEKGMFYLVNVTSFINNGTLYGKVNIPYIIPDTYRNIDIDTKLEMDIAELVHRKHM